MKHGLSLRLALGNIRKNYRFFIPRILTETGLVACFYIIFTLACDGRLSEIKGGSYIPTFMLMGTVIIGLLSAVLTLYTNSFLMKQRKREFGLYSVLGMEKKDICRILFYESGFCSIVSAAAGLLFGILLYKLSSVAICKLLKSDIILGLYYITPKTLFPAGAVFLAMDTAAYFLNCISIAVMKPVELLSSRNYGEKEPKVKWIMLILGVACLGAGYGISVTVKNPLSALLLFFVAVLLVIAGTYFLFVSGSIFVLKLLKSRKNYYYKSSHMTAVSGLIYRMKQNAVGLSSVAILATGVLVMTSTTFCLYSRTEDVLEQNYPQDYYLSASYFDCDANSVDIPENVIADITQSSAEAEGLKIKDGFSQKFLETAFIHKPGCLSADIETVRNETDIAGICDIIFITEEMYEKLGGQPIGLKENEVAVCPYNINYDFSDENFSLGGNNYTVARRLTFFPIKSVQISVNRYGMVVANDGVFDSIFNFQKEAYGEYCSELQNRYCLTFENKEISAETGKNFSADVEERLKEYILSSGSSYYRLPEYDGVWEARENLYGMYGTLLFLGGLLGIVCLFATVLIIYYKQISEGYEDRNRYQIMRKIGMTDREVKNSIRTQIMLVFFLPLITAGIHIAFAFPMLTKLMEVLLLDNTFLFARWCAIVYIAFALFYALIYKVTAKTYYKIVY